MSGSICAPIACAPTSGRCRYGTTTSTGSSSSSSLFFVSDPARPPGRRRRRREDGYTSLERGCRPCFFASSPEPGVGAARMTFDNRSITSRACNAVTCRRTRSTSRSEPSSEVKLSEARAEGIDAAALFEVDGSQVTESVLGTSILAGRVWEAETASSRSSSSPAPEPKDEAEAEALLAARSSAACSASCRARSPLKREIPPLLGPPPPAMTAAGAIGRNEKTRVPPGPARLPGCAGGPCCAAVELEGAGVEVGRSGLPEAVVAAEEEMAAGGLVRREGKTQC